MQVMGWHLLHPRTRLGIALVLGAAALIVAVGVGVTIGLGLYNIAADAPTRGRSTRP